MYCHNCKQTAFVRTEGKRYTPPKSDVIKRIKQRKSPDVINRTRDYVSLPRDTNKEFSIDGLMWLRKYGITDAEIETYNIGWSDTYQRVILPVYKEGSLVYWQGRYVGDNPAESKYLNVITSKHGVFFSTNGDNSSNTIVIVEDILSAIAIQRSGFRAIALLGSNLPDYVIHSLINEASLHETLQVKVWLDSDKKLDSIKYSSRLNTFNIKSTWVSTVLDPKCYTAEQIIEHLK